MSQADKRRQREPPPEADDPRYVRRCNRCNAARGWMVATCLKCGCPEFRLPLFVQGDLFGLAAEAVSG